jgi:DNA-binding SARP family transcriptional activator
VLGPLRIEAAGEEIVTGLRSTARELLAYLALRPDGATGETFVEALWPDRPPDPDNTRVQSALKSIRSRLRAATGARNAMFVTHIAGRYRLDTNLVTTYVAEFQSLIARAAAPVTWTARPQRCTTQ